MSQMHLELRHLRTVRAIHEQGGLARAASVLNITQSALSHQVKALEDQAGVELFTRRAKPMRLSPAGMRLLRRDALTSLDLAWTADGLQRDGPHVREPVDQLIRQALQHHQLPYKVVAGRGVARVQHALLAIEHLMDAPQRQLRAASSPRWRWYCDHCDDGECEQHGLGDVRA